MSNPEKNEKGRRIWSIAALGMSEALGTALLLLFGCMGGLPGLGGGAPPPLQSNLVFGLTVAAIVQIFGHVSGAHLNPAVTAAAWIYGLVNIPTAIVYILAQFVGATLGYSALVVISPASAFYGEGIVNGTHNFCTTTPGSSVTVTSALLGEYLATSVLILLCCGVWDRRNEAKQDGVPIKFGLTIAMLALAEGPYSGCSMNPARTFGPALITGEWRSHWIYWIGPMAAGIMIPYMYKFAFDRNSQPIEDDSADIPLNQTNAKSKESMEALPNV